MPTARAPQQGADLSGRGEQDTLEYRVSVQGEGIEHGTSSLRPVAIRLTRPQGTMICGWDKTVRVVDASWYI